MNVPFGASTTAQQREAQRQERERERLEKERLEREEVNQLSEEQKEEIREAVSRFCSMRVEFVRVKNWNSVMLFPRDLRLRSFPSNCFSQIA